MNVKRILFMTLAAAPVAMIAQNQTGQMEAKASDSEKDYSYRAQYTGEMWTELTRTNKAVCEEGIDVVHRLCNPEYVFTNKQGKKKTVKRDVKYFNQKSEDKFLNAVIALNALGEGRIQSADKNDTEVLGILVRLRDSCTSNGMTAAASSSGRDTSVSAHVNDVKVVVEGLSGIDCADAEEKTLKDAAITGIKSPLDALLNALKETVAVSDEDLKATCGAPTAESVSSALASFLGIDAGWMQVVRAHAPALKIDKEAAESDDTSVKRKAIEAAITEWYKSFTTHITGANKLTLTSDDLKAILQSKRKIARVLDGSKAVPLPIERLLWALNSSSKMPVAITNWDGRDDELTSQIEETVLSWNELNISGPDLAEAIANDHANWEAALRQYVSDKKDPEVTNEHADVIKDRFSAFVNALESIKSSYSKVNGDAIKVTNVDRFANFKVALLDAVWDEVREQLTDGRLGTQPLSDEDWNRVEDFFDGLGLAKPDKSLNRFKLGVTWENAAASLLTHEDVFDIAERYASSRKAAADDASAVADILEQYREKGVLSASVMDDVNDAETVADKLDLLLAEIDSVQTSWRRDSSGIQETETYKKLDALYTELAERYSELEKRIKPDAGGDHSEYTNLLGQLKSMGYTYDEKSKALTPPAGGALPPLHGLSSPTVEQVFGKNTKTGTGDNDRKPESSSKSGKFTAWS